MAKSHSLLKLQGTYSDITFVRSRAYGDHVRAKRGTYKEAKVNDAFKSESKQLVGANVPAKIFKDAIDPYRTDIAEGQLWQRLVSIFRRQLNDHGQYDFGRLPQFELHSKHTLGRLLRISTTTSFDKDDSLLQVTINYDLHPKFTKARNVDGYVLSIIGVFPDSKRKTAAARLVTSETIGLTKSPKPVRFQLEVPKRTKCYVVCVKIEGCVNGIPSGFVSTMGMKVVESGWL